MRRSTRLILILTAVALCGCISRQEHARILAGASRDCSQDSDCVIVGIENTGCTCPDIVNRRDQVKVDTASRRVFCGRTNVECIDVGTPVCREGLCTWRTDLP